MSRLSKVELFDGVQLPCAELQRPSNQEEESKTLLVFGHGLSGQAFGDPFPTDDGTGMLEAALAAFAAREPPMRSASIPRVVVYDARGHGASENWQQGGFAQHHWRSLAVDMLQVAAAHRQDGAAAVLGGCSMGAATALWASLLCPGAVRGLVLFKVPSIRELRDGRRQQLVNRAEKNRASNPALADRDLGAAKADVPELTEFAVVKIPVLLACAKDDPVHPAGTAEALKAHLPNVTLVMTETTDELYQAFQEALSLWLEALPSP
mmetsp:Transcript_45059/g.97857  ORF Transcript_45059/g.97857 Transcript_45059/m.97857 type:complete len:265 (-) Transcript_45059:178-972(-)